MFSILVGANLHNEERYMVEFDDQHQVMTEEQLIGFVRIAVINNKDVSNFEVHRIQDIDVDEYGQAHYVY